uniref:Fe2OG dioxygenase domain-containing protein n=1 Tax=Chromera velia CCMP2878 TaxID=1169474 RepID=A0A0G4IBS4_9ALVE|eukprot:Cvel_12903.t1-p1 / transcript=Cvel_12903.t1 / gene=Cvel_12903 / organism=Chromera_velia_CCMP2878 / gene_product=Gibberellin 3-beta-dioxygenase 2-3, putative / transcript_product=Gibberellin 3-beta-dioxygenase 2-3, putative / location=Cvel_scaffold862:27326-28408(-) / protein_length=361 / sequence_SO=supercontig / SO=protein_coding / is_pseudo=false
MSSKTFELPVVDLASLQKLMDRDPLPASVVDAIGQAFDRCGFAAVINHGLKSIPRCETASTAWFRSPLTEKMSVAANGEPFGYFPMFSESLNSLEPPPEGLPAPDLREAFSMGPQHDPTARLQQVLQEKTNLREVADFCFSKTPWPDQMQKGDCRVAGEFCDSLKCFYEEASCLGQNLLRCVAKAMGLDERHFDQGSAAQEHTNSGRAIWYPKLTEAPLPNQARCGAHADSGALTLLYCGAPGLEIQLPGSSEWVPVESPPGSLVINIGELAARATKGRWRSTPHRVPAPSSLDSAENVDRLVLVLFVILAPDFPVDESGLTQGEYTISRFKRWGRVVKSEGETENEIAREQNGVNGKTAK